MLSKEIKDKLYQKIDPFVFNGESDTITIFYSVLGVITMKKEDKY